MSTPKKIKRFQSRPSEGHDLNTYLHGLSNPAYAERLGQIVASFGHLENSMGFVLAILLGDTDSETAGFVLRSIKSPKGRTDVMRDLLEKAPQNAQLSEEFDNYIKRFSQISIQRNRWVHGLWWTHSTTDTVLFAAENEDGFGFDRATSPTLVELDGLLQEILDLKTKVLLDVILGNEGLVEHRRRAGTTPPP